MPLPFHSPACRPTPRRSVALIAGVSVSSLLLGGVVAVSTAGATSPWSCELQAAPTSSTGPRLGQPQVCTRTTQSAPAPVVTSPSPSPSATAPAPAPAPTLVTTAPSPTPTAPSPTPTAPSPTPTATVAPPPAPTSIEGVLALGSVRRGPAATSTPVVDRQVAVGQLTQALLDASPEGTVFGVAPGVHRLTTPLRPKTGQGFIGLPGAVLSGAQPVTGWVAEGGVWFVDGQTQRLPLRDTGGYNACDTGSPMCEHPEDVFLDDVPLRQVGSRAEVGPGTFWLDRATSRLWVGTDPRNRRAETTHGSQAIVGRSTLVRDLVVEKFGNPAQTGALHGTDLKVERSLVRLNHGTGIFNYGGWITDSIIADNGQMGLGAGGAGQRVENNEIARNGRVGFDPGWEAGGTKWAHSSDLVVRGNWSHHNVGNGLWTDINNTRSLYERNLVEDNAYNGIFHEISYSATIRGNVTRRNGTRDTWFNSRVGINVTNSRGVTVHDNVVEDNAGGGIVGVQDPRVGGSGPEGTWELERLVVRDNTVRMRPNSRGAYSGIWIYDELPNRASYYTSRGNVFTRNNYTVPDPAGRWFLGGDTLGGVDWVKTWSRWQALGGDAGGSLRAG